MADNPHVLTFAHPLVYFTCEDGEPWALFCWGDVPPSLFTPGRCIEALMHYGGLDRADAEELLAKPAHTPRALWLQVDGVGEDYPYYFCAANHPGAQRITGIRFT